MLRGRKSLSQKNVAMEKYKCINTKRIPIVVLEKLVVNPTNSIICNQEIIKVKNKNNSLDIRQQDANKDVKFKSLRNKQIKIQQSRETKNLFSKVEKENEKKMDLILISLDKNPLSTKSLVNNINTKEDCVPNFNSLCNKITTNTDCNTQHKKIKKRKKLNKRFIVNKKVKGDCLKDIKQDNFANNITDHQTEIHKATNTEHLADPENTIEQNINNVSITVSSEVKLNNTIPVQITVQITKKQLHKSVENETQITENINKKINANSAAVKSNENVSIQMGIDKNVSVSSPEITTIGKDLEVKNSKDTKPEKCIHKHSIKVDSAINERILEHSDNFNEDCKQVAVNAHQAVPRVSDQDCNNIKEVPKVLRNTDSSDDEEVYVRNNCVLIDQNSPQFFEDDEHVEEEDPLQVGENFTEPLEASKKLIHCPMCKTDYPSIYFNEHWIRCSSDLRLPCEYCKSELKSERTLLNHLKKTHSDRVPETEVQSIVDATVKKFGSPTKVKLNKKYVKITTDIPLPDFIRVYCKSCFTLHETLPPTYRKICEHCYHVLTFHCNRCHKHSLTSSQIVRHLRAECNLNPNGQMECADCKNVASKTLKSQPLPKKLQRNQIYCGLKTNLTCRFCNFKSKHKSGMKLHIQSHVLNKNQSLQKSDKPNLSLQETTVSDAVRKKHGENIEQMIDIKCLVCKNKNEDTSSRKLRTCLKCKVPERFVCNVCQRNNSSYYRLYIHVARMHAKKIFFCNKCKRSFSYESDYTQHGKYCPKTANHQCKLCTYQSQEYKALKEHMKCRHSNKAQQSFECSRCSRGYLVYSSYKKHVRVCGNTPNLACDHCKYKSFSKYAIARHVQSVHAKELFPDVQFNCQSCCKKFTNLFKFEAHVRKCSS